MNCIFVLFCFLVFNVLFVFFLCVVGIIRRFVVFLEVIVGACFGVDLGDASFVVFLFDVGKDFLVIWISGEL